MDKHCIIIGASHAGVTAAFALRKSGWEGAITLIDADPHLPYHRPPLSKAFLTRDHGIRQYALRPLAAYEKADIGLRLGEKVTSIERENKIIYLGNGEPQAYDKLILATGASPFIPPISGLAQAQYVYPLRTATDVLHIQAALQGIENPQLVIIGGGYIGLETAASLRKLGIAVSILEREERLLARVTAPELSTFFKSYHEARGVDIYLGKQVEHVRQEGGRQIVSCADGSSFPADLIVLGCGIRLHTELAEAAGLEVENGIKVGESAQTSDPHIFAIGDCSWHYNPYYDRYIRLESVQHATDQAKVAAAALAGQQVVYDKIPWFWSEQYDLKLQMVGLSAGYDEVILRQESETAPKFSLWYFKGDTLLAVDAVNHTKAYVMGTKFLKARLPLDKSILENPKHDLKMLAGPV